MEQNKLRCHACGWASVAAFATRTDVDGKEVLGCPSCRGIGTVADVCAVDNCWNFMPCPHHGAAE
jgi:hypothetical protein